jgi:hypothetical protein
MMAWGDQSTKDLKRHIERLQWAADTTDDPLWRQQHLWDKAECERIIESRSRIIEARRSGERGK